MMRLYDTALQNVVPFEPGPTVLMYTCGITPYDATHLGHAFTFISYDVLQRRLIDMGHQVKCVRNVTDVDDPLFAKARELGVHYLDLAAGEEERFERDMDALNALKVHSTPRASSAIPDIRGFIGMVIDRGFAYQAGGSVYFDVTKSANFGDISHYDSETMIALARERGGNVEDTNKRHPLDFVLWHPSASDEPSWDTMWGAGRPGWQCERAQSVAATGAPFVKHWMHVAMVSMDGHKMSKSRGNLVFVDKLRTENDPMAIRLGLIEHHYRVEWEWDEGLMTRNQERLSKWRATRSATKVANGRTVLEDVRDALDDDLDTPAAVRMIDDAAQRGFDVGDAAALLGVLM